jgi:hypothetical protein
MKPIACARLLLVFTVIRSRVSLQLEIVALRRQSLNVLLAGVQWRGFEPVLPENTYYLIFLTFFRGAVNLVSSIIVRIQSHEAHCLLVDTACIYRDPFAGFPATRDCGTAASACCVSENNQTNARRLALETVFSGRGSRAAGRDGGMLCFLSRQGR